MRTEHDLRQALRTHAGEVAAWPAPHFHPPAPRTSHRTAVSVFITVSAILLTLVALPTMVSHTHHASSATPANSTKDAPHARRSGPMSQPSASLRPQDWVATRCATHARCDIPDALVWGKVQLVALGRGVRSVEHPPLHIKTLPIRLAGYLQQPGTHYILIGNREGSVSAHLQLKVGNGPWRALPGGRPSMVEMVTTSAHESVAIRDTQQPHVGSLFIQGYVTEH